MSLQSGHGDGSVASGYTASSDNGNQGHTNPVSWHMYSPVRQRRGQDARGI